jgi:hypothetical protein
MIVMGFLGFSGFGQLFQSNLAKYFSKTADKGRKAVGCLANYFFAPQHNAID